MQHTPEQKAVIESSVGNLLVSAAAGSGKTAVLTDRIVQRIMAGQLDIRQVLVMTFTEAAARSMKEKIETKLRAALDQEKNASSRQRLSRQLSLLPGASISTIHAFCLDVIRNFYYCARDEQGQPLIEPGFGIDDGVESELMLRQTLDEWMNNQYEAIDLAGSRPEEIAADASLAQKTEQWQTAFYRLIEGYGDSRSDQAVRELILRLHRFLRSLPDYAAFVKTRLQELRDAAADFSSSPHNRELVRMLRVYIDRAHSRMDELQALLDGKIRFIGKADRNEAYSQQFQATFLALRQLKAYLDNGGHDWDRIREISGGLAELSLPRKSRGDSPEKQAFMALFCEFVAEAAYFLSGSCGTAKCRRHFIFDTRYVFCLPSTKIEADIKAMLPQVDLLFDLTLGLDQQYAARKRAAGLIDFSDFEHLALTILKQEEPCQYYRQRFTEVYVDEYQDTSSIQEAIIQAVSNGNCLMVGDVKQSIYRFRHARPRIFMGKAASYQSGHAGRLHELNRNFRSVEGILTAANELFSQLMSSGAGEIEYDDSQALMPYRPDNPSCPSPVELLLLNRLPPQDAASSAAGPAEETPDEAAETLAGEDDLPAAADEEERAQAEDLSRDQQEALLVINKMHQLHDGGHPWQDMAVLCRTRAIGLTYQSQLEAHGIPTWIDTAKAYLDTPVLRQMEALVHILDNIRQDIPLTAVMRSDLYQGGFTINELALIRLDAKKTNPDCRFYHQAVFDYAAHGEDPKLCQRVQDFLNWLDALRQQEQVLSIGELIGLIFAETGWLDRLSARPDGSQQVNDLRQFQQWAEQFESRRQRGLYAFARYLENLRSKGSIDSPFDAKPADQETVRIMTIHGSKGLEFPIVFLVGTGYRITPKDNNDCLLLSETLGIGMDFADPKLQVRYPTHLKLAMLEEIKAAGLAEEMRLLYVAVTRAMDQLYIAGTMRLRPGVGDSRLQMLWQQAQTCVSRKLPDYLVLSGKNYLEWLVLALARQPGLDWSFLESGVIPEGGQSGVSTSEKATAWNLNLYQLATLQQELAARSNKPGPDGQALSGQQNSQTADGNNPAALIEDALSELPGQGRNEEAYRETWQRIAAPYRFEQAARTPVKLTVSELKRREQIAESELFEEESGFVRGIGLMMRNLPSEKETLAIKPSQSKTDSAPARLGTLLHSVFRYLDLPAACQQPDLFEIDRQLAAMHAAKMLSDDELAMVSPLAPAILAFVQSGLAAEMVKAFQDPRRPIYQEMPFTLAVPACGVYPEKAGLAGEDQVLVQGIIDCWYENGAGITLVDYKSDRLPDDPALCQAGLISRYALQLDYYALAIQKATGKPVNRRLIWLVRQGRSYDLTPMQVET